MKRLLLKAISNRIFKPTDLKEFAFNSSIYKEIGIQSNFKERGMYGWPQMSTTSTLRLRGSLLLNGRSPCLDTAYGSLDYWLRLHRIGALTRGAAGSVTLSKRLLCPAAFQNNYFHWLIETLPALVLSKRHRTHNGIYVLADCKPFHVDSLEFFGLSASGYITESDISLDNAHVVAPVGQSLAVSKGRVHLNHHALAAFRKEARRRVANTGFPSSRIYISRQRQLTRAVANHHELVELLNNHGFAEVYLEDMQFGDQVACLSNAEIIVAPHGAGIANTLFAPTGSRLIELFPVERHQDTRWQFVHLSQVSGINHIVLGCPSSGPLQTLQVDLLALENILSESEI